MKQGDTPRFQIRKLREEVEESRDRLSTLVANIDIFAHDVSNVLADIVSCLPNADPDDGRRQEILSKISIVREQMEDSVTDFLGFTDDQD